MKTEPEQWAKELAVELAALGRKCQCKKCMTHDAKVIVRAVKRRDQALKETPDAQ